METIYIEKKELLERIKHFKGNNKKLKKMVSLSQAKQFKVFILDGVVLNIFDDEKDIYLKKNATKSNKYKDQDTYYYHSKKRAANMKAKISDGIVKKELDFSKISPSLKVFDLLNSPYTSLAVKGERGSGKTTVINEALSEFELYKGFRNIFVLSLLWLCWLVSFLFGNENRATIERKIAKRRCKKININLWSIFGLRDRNDYHKKMSTARISEDLSDIRSFKDEFATHLFVKKAIWKTIASAMSISSFTKLSVKRALENDTFYYSKNLKRKSVFTTLKFWVSISLILLIPFIILFVFLYDDADIISKNRAVLASAVPSIFSFISTIIILVVTKLSKGDNGAEKQLNSLLIDPSYNSIIPAVLENMSKRRLIILHFSEIDRLHKWLAADDEEKADELIKSIASTLGLIYIIKNFNVVIEIDNKVNDAILVRDKAGEADADVVDKLFTSVVNVPFLSESELKKQGNFDTPYIKYIYSALSSFDSKPSWRNKDEYIEAIKNNPITKMTKFSIFDGLTIENIIEFYRRDLNSLFNEKITDYKYELKASGRHFYIRRSNNGELGINHLLKVFKANGIRTSGANILFSDFKYYDEEELLKIAKTTNFKIDSLTPSFKRGVIQAISEHSDNVLNYLYQNRLRMFFDFAINRTTGNFNDTIDSRIIRANSKKITEMIWEVPTEEREFLLGESSIIRRLSKRQMKDIEEAGMSNEKLWNYQPTIFSLKANFDMDKILIRESNVEEFISDTSKLMTINAIGKLEAFFASENINILKSRRKIVMDLRTYGILFNTMKERIKISLK